MKKVFVLFLSTLILVACGSPASSESSSEKSGQPGSESVETNDGYFIVEDPDILSDDWKTMTFYYDGNVYDWLGKPVSNIDDTWYGYLDTSTTEELQPGQKAYLTVTQDPLQEGVPINPFYITAVNDSLEVASFETAKIINISADSSAFDNFEVEDEENADYTNYANKGFILPSGIVAGDAIEKATAHYGEGDMTKDILFNVYSYQTEETQMKLAAYEGKLMQFTYALTTLPDYYLKAYEASQDFSPEANAESFINLGGYKLYLRTPFKDVAESLKLVIPPEPEFYDSLVSQTEDTIIEPYSEINYQVVATGFSKTILTFRLYNETNAPIKPLEATVLGVRITKSDVYEDSAEDSFHLSLPITAPLGIRLGGNMTEEFKKIPDTANEKVLADDGGAYASINDGVINYHIFGKPKYDWREDINELMFTLLSY